MKGIYKITNIIDGKFYIGSSNNIFSRLGNHFSLLVKNNHDNYKLQNAFNEVGYKNFKFEVLEILPTATTKLEMLKKEQVYISTLMSYLDDVGYNINDTTCSETKNMYNVVSDGGLDEVILNKEVKTLLSKNLNIYLKNNDKILLRYMDKNSISTSWLGKDKDDLKTLSNDILNYLQNKIKVKAKEHYWTCHSKYKDQLSRKGMYRTWVAPNIANVKERRNNLVFAMNIFANEYKLRNENIVDFDKDKYALCFIVSWICSVADITKPINIYIPSKRMRELLINWLEV